MMISRRWRPNRALLAMCKRFLSAGCILMFFAVVLLLHVLTEPDMSRGSRKLMKRRNSGQNPDPSGDQDINFREQNNVFIGDNLNGVQADNSLKESSVKEKVISTEANFEDDVQHRFQTYSQSCFRKQGTSLASDIRSFIVADPGMKMAYCFVAKIACTFWLRIFAFLTRPGDMVALNITSPSEINRAALHWGQLLPKPRFSLQDFRALSKSNTVNFVFARNPYERLWSVYLDKYYLPDYWLIQPLGTSKCGVNTTFIQFLNHAITSQDHHVIPVSEACNPCVYKPEIVGKLETFSRDAKQILNRTGFGHLMDNYNRSYYVEVEIKTLVSYNFNLLTAHGLTLSNCLTPKSLSQRLWRVFQINGHLKSDAVFPDNLSDYSVKSVIDACLKEAADEPLTSAQAKEQRRKSIIEAYARIPPSLIEGIRLRYQHDFEMFDYSPHPPT